MKVCLHLVPVKALFRWRPMGAWKLFGLLVWVSLAMLEDLPAQPIYNDTPPGQQAAASQSQGELPYNEGLPVQAAQVSQAEAQVPYNIAIGPVTLRAAASVSTTYNSNINIAQTGGESDIIIQPAVDITGLWQATELNSLSFDLGLGYQEYIIHSENSGFILAPTSGAQFNVFVGETKINLHDQFSYQQDPLSVGQLSNISQFSRFSNDAGLTLSWDVSNDLSVSVGYDHSNLWVLQSTYQYLTYQSDAISPKVTYNLNESIQTGVATSFTSTRYDQNIQNNNLSFTAGPFVTAHISDFLSVNAQMGAVFTNYATGGLNGDTENISSWYGNFGVTHKINDVLTQSFVAGKEYLPGVTSNFTQRVYANYGPTWQATSYLNVSANLWFENLNDSAATFSQDSNRYGAGINLGWAASDHATVSFGYQYVLKNADVPNLGYTQNQATIAVRYQF